MWLSGQRSGYECLSGSAGKQYQFFGTEVMVRYDAPTGTMQRIPGSSDKRTTTRSLDLKHLFWRPWHVSGEECAKFGQLPAAVQKPILQYLIPRAEINSPPPTAVL